MIEATQEPAQTIAGFLKNVSEEELGVSPVMIIDEASMLDLVTAFRIIKRLPPGAKLILVGDPYQLPPIGAGLVFHLLCESDRVPKSELTVVKRQAAESLIPTVANSIRNGVWPSLPSKDSDVLFIKCDPKDIPSRVLELYGENPDQTQVLCATRLSRTSGTRVINDVIKAKYANDTGLLVENEYTGEIERVEISRNDKIMFTANDWPRDLQNGSLGRVEEVFKSAREVNIGTLDNPKIEIALARATYDDVEHFVLDRDVDHIELAYAITVHKSQGSQFKRVIIPVTRSRVIDRTFLYTAITRATDEVIIVGDEEACRKATEALPTAFKRKVGLRYMI